MHFVILICMSLIPAFNYTIGFKTESWYISENGKDRALCGWSAISPCKSFSRTLGNFHRKTGSTTVHLWTDASLKVDSMLMASNAWLKTSFLSITFGGYQMTHNSVTFPTLNISGVNFLGSQWNITNMNVEICRSSLVGMYLAVQSEIPTKSLANEIFLKLSIGNSSIGHLDAKNVFLSVSNVYMTNQYNRSREIFALRNSKAHFLKCTFMDVVSASLSIDTSAVIAAWSSSITIESSTFVDNYAKYANIFVSKNTILNIRDSNFFGNYGKFGSAVFANGNSTAFIQNCTFRNGQAQRGGAIDLSYHSTIHITTSIFSENSAFQGGAINAQESSNLYINKSIFDNNKAYYGSALFIIDNSSSYVECSNFTSNVAEVAAAVYVQQNSNLTLGFSSFINNTGKDIAAIALTDHVFSKVYSVHFIENKADYGSILVIQNSCLDMETSELISNEGWYISCIRIANDSASTLQYTDFIMNVALNNSTALHIHSVGTINIWNVHNFTMSGCNFINNTSIWASALSARNVSYMHIHNSTFHGNIGSALWIQETRELIIEDCYLIKNRPNIFEEGTVLTLFNYTNGYISESYFIGNIAGDQNGIIIQEHSSLTMYKCHLENNTGSTGVAALKQVFLNVTDTEFVGNAAHEGAGIALEQGTAVFIERCMFLRNTAEIGSAIQGRNNVTIKIVDTNFEENVSNQVGTVTVRQNGDITVENCKFYSNMAGQGGAINLSYHINATIVKTVFHGNMAGPKTIHKTKHPYSTPKLNQEFDRMTQPAGGAIVANGNVTLTLLLCHFVSNSVPNHDSFGGALLLIQDISVTIVSCIIELNAAQMGGAICARLFVFLLIEETIFLHNSARGNGGAIQAESNVSLILSRVNLSRNTAEIVSTIDIRVQSSLQITESNFVENAAEIQISMLSAVSSKVILENCQFFQNRANQLPLIFLDKSMLVINNTQIRDTSNETTNIIAATSSEIKILHCIFYNNTSQVPKRNPMTLTLDASLIVVDRNTRLEIANCSFSKNYRTIIVNAVSNSTVKIERCTFTENYHIGMVFTDKRNEIIFESSRIEYNVAMQFSGLIDLSKESKLFIRNSHVTNNSARQYGRSGIINGGDKIKILIRSSTFSSNTAIGEGGVISISGGELYSTLQIVDSHFSHNHPTGQGAVMYIQNCNIVIDSCIFEGNTSALSLIDIKNLRTSNTTFRSIGWPSIDITQRKLGNTTYRTYKAIFERQNETIRSFETDFIDNIIILTRIQIIHQYIPVSKIIGVPFIV